MTMTGLIPTNCTEKRMYDDDGLQAGAGNEVEYHWGRFPEST